MKTLIINGSPNGKKGNTEILSQMFIEGMESKPEIRYVSTEDPTELAAYMNEFDRWLFFFPLYVNTMPGIVKRLFEHMTKDTSKSIGFFVQSGFEEAFQSDWLAAVLKNFIKRMGYIDIGIVIAGGMAGVRFMPESMNRNTFEMMKKAGLQFHETGVLSKETKEYFGRLYRYDEKQIKRNTFFKKLGLTNFFWNRMIKSNKAYHKRYDKPFGI